MSRNHYAGGSTKVGVGEEGTRWEVDWDIEQEIHQHYKRWHPQGGIKPDADVMVWKRRRKEFTYFMLACARAFAEETLSSSFPPWPDWLRKEIKRAGGNVRWLQSDGLRLGLLTRLVNVRQRSASAQTTGDGASQNIEAGPSVR